MESTGPNWTVFIPVILGVVFGLLGLIFLIIALVSRKKAQTSQSWPTTPGTVLSSSIEEHTEFDSENQSNSINFQPVVQYRYKVMGQEYIGSKIAFGANRFDHARAQSISSRYVPNAAVTVHYNPQNPQDAILETQAAGSKVFLWIGIVFLVIAVSACCLTVVLLVSNMSA
jgi:hypothetical protein